MYPIPLHLVSWNRPKMTELVIKTIHRNTIRDDFLLRVWDNGSEPETVEMLKNLHDNGYIDELIPCDTNEGLEQARQQLLMARETRGQYFVDIDNDCLPPVNWLKDQVRLMERNPEYAAISQRTQVMIGTGNIFEDETKDITDFPHPGGSFRLMNTRTALEVGGWDRGAPGRGTEERYICGKLRDAGYKTGFATHILCLHLFGTRGEHGTDRWGYDKDWAPEQTGHSDIWHPVLGNGDDYNEILAYSGRELADAYYNYQEV